MIEMMLAPFTRTVALQPVPGHADGGALLAGAMETGGMFSLAVFETHRGYEPPPHIHHGEHEAFFILDGEMTAHVGGRALPARPGDFVFLPRGIAHTFSVETATMRTLLLAVPGGIERYFAASQQRAATADEIAVAAKYGIEYTTSTEVIAPGATPLRPFVHSRTPENTRLYIDRVLTTFFATADETGGEFAFIQSTGRKGGEPMRHIHHREDECFFILEGQITATIGAATFVAPAGTAVFLPKGIPHSFTVDSDDASFLNVIAPGNFAGFFAELSTTVTSLTLPPAPATPPDIERVMAVSAKYGIEYVFQD